MIGLDMFTELNQYHVFILCWLVLFGVIMAVLFKAP